MFKDVLAFDLLPLFVWIQELREHFLVFHVSLGSAPIKMLTLTSVLCCIFYLTLN